MGTSTYDPSEVVELFGEADAKELLRLAHSDLKTRLGAFQESLAKGETALAAKAAHSMAGVSGNVMAMGLSDLARAVETALIEGGSVPDALVSQLTEETALVLSAVETFLG